MSKNTKSRSGRSKKKKSRNKAASRARSKRPEQKSVEQIQSAAPEQLNIEAPEAPEVKIDLYDPNDESEDEQDAAVAAPVIPAAVETADKGEILRELDEYSENIKKANAEKCVNAAAQKPAAQKKAHKRSLTGLKVVCALAALLVYCAAVIYGFFWIDDNIIDPDIYPKGTTLNGVDVSGMDLQQAEEALTDDWNTHTLGISDVYGKEIDRLDGFDFSYDIDDQLGQALSPGAETAIMRFFQKEKEDITIKMDPEESTEHFRKQFGELSIVREAKGNKPSKNAYIDKSDTEFRIVKEVIGNSVDTRLLQKAVLEAISEGDETFEFRRSDFHKMPKIVSTSESLLEEQKYCRKYLSFQITLRNPVNEYTIPPSWLDKMMTVDKKGKAKINDEQVSQFVSEMIYPKFSSVGDTRTLKSAGGGRYTISGGTYGYVIDVQKEHDMLTSELKDGEDVEREPYYSGKSPGKNWKNDIGNDYIEVSIDKQTCWVVRNGKTVVETPVVTGVLPRHATPKGVYYIVYKATHTTLKGRNDDGSKYESKVAYWMPFYLGFGLHDASWRGAFGGSIYVYNGSHGCVNCPPSIMPQIFSNSYEGMPVIVH